MKNDKNQQKLSGHEARKLISSERNRFYKYLFAAKIFLLLIFLFGMFVPSDETSVNVVSGIFLLLTAIIGVLSTINQSEAISRVNKKLLKNVAPISVASALIGGAVSWFLLFIIGAILFSLKACSVSPKCI